MDEFRKDVEVLEDEGWDLDYLIPVLLVGLFLTACVSGVALFHVFVYPIF